MKPFFTIFILLTITQASQLIANTPPEYHPSETQCLNLSCICRVLDSIYPTDGEFDRDLISDIDLICPEYMAAVGEPCLQVDDLAPSDYDESGVPFIDYATFCA